jgi:hypothetical protein
VNPTTSEKKTVTMPLRSGAGRSPRPSASATCGGNIPRAAVSAAAARAWSGPEPATAEGPVEPESDAMSPTPPSSIAASRRSTSAKGGRIAGSRRMQSAISAAASADAPGGVPRAGAAAVAAPPLPPPALPAEEEAEEAAEGARRPSCGVRRVSSS